MLTEDGSCMNCPEFTRVQDETECGPDECSEYEILKEDGTCQECDL